jgi:hypothetical protein
MSARREALLRQYEKEKHKTVVAIAKVAVKPTYPDNARTSKEDARAELERVIEAFFDAKPGAYEAFADIDHVVQALCATTGIGKTKAAAQVIARRIANGRLAVPIGYAVPTHRLGEDVAADHFRKYGLNAELWRGRKAFIKGKSGPKMCDDLAVVEIAEDMGAVIETSCCKGKDPSGNKRTCQFYHSCAYQKQKTKKPDVWLFAHQMLFQQNKTLKNLSVIFIDESFRDAGTSKPTRGLTIDEIKSPTSIAELNFYRDWLANALWTQPNNGGVPRANLVAAGLNTANCTRAITLEWSQKEKQTTLWPGMPTRLRKAAAKAGSNVRHIRTFDRVWRAARELLELGDGTVSGRLFMATQKTENGVVRIVRTRGLRKVVEQYQVPTFIMDATLPSREILSKWFPAVQIVSNIEVPTMYVDVKQVLSAPVAEKKLTGGIKLRFAEKGVAATRKLQIEIKRLAGKRNLRAIRRYILREWVKAGRGPAVVIMQKGPEAVLLATGLPFIKQEGSEAALLPTGLPGIATEHFNAISGTDIHKSVRLLMTIGCTLPPPAAIEEDAGALTGVEPVKAPITPNGSRWYGEVTRVIRMRDGTGVPVTSRTLHTDPLGEDVRYQVCEAQGMQSIGRDRGVNREADQPLTRVIMTDVVLPITVDQVEKWQVPGLDEEMTAEGIWLESPTDMAKAWPDDWATPQAAKDWLRSGVVRKMVEFPLREDSLQGKLHHLRYQPAGTKQRWRTAWVDPAVVPNPRKWLENRLGPIAAFEVTAIYFVLKPPPVELRLVAGTPWVTVGPQKRPWSTPAVEELFVSPKERAALDRLPVILDGGPVLDKRAA